jgi:serine/threonine protein phosphatase 1
LLSYPIDRETYDRATLSELRKMMPTFIPAADIAFIEAMEDQIAIGDYLFVHAGIRPGVALDQQKGSDLRWIRREFLDNTSDYGCVVVHGHTITDEVEERGNRIGIDTGAYASGRLTAIGLEGTERWFLETEPPIE